MESTTNDNPIFECGTCQQKCTFENVQIHPCVQGYAEVVLTDNNQFYPKTSEGQVITRVKMKVLMILKKLIRKMSISLILPVQRSSDMIIASMEEILISAV